MVYTRLMFWFIVLMPILIGCGLQKEPVYHVEAGAEHIASFIQAANRQGVKIQANNLIVRLTALPTNMMGKCYKSKRQNTITLSPLYWTVLSPLDQQQLMWHELGHCWLGRGHDNSTLPDGSPASIMNTYHFAQDLYWMHYEHYVNELFGG